MAGVPSRGVLAPRAAGVQGAVYVRDTQPGLQPGPLSAGGDQCGRAARHVERLRHGHPAQLQGIGAVSSAPAIRGAASLHIPALRANGQCGRRHGGHRRMAELGCRRFLGSQPKPGASRDQLFLQRVVTDAPEGTHSAGQPDHSPGLHHPQIPEIEERKSVPPYAQGAAACTDVVHVLAAPAPLVKSSGYCALAHTCVALVCT
mmetsp:Transcript_29497/g.74163  ORF Transcript_29497/g.74163 Transcript_29497/m.74163 type:complete len:203 (-) Transcript_29497:13-621(-)